MNGHFTSFRSQFKFCESSKTHCWRSETLWNFVKLCYWNFNKFHWDFNLKLPNPTVIYPHGKYHRIVTQPFNLNSLFTRMLNFLRKSIRFRGYSETLNFNSTPVRGARNSIRWKVIARKNVNRKLWSENVIEANYHLYLVI